MILRERKSKSQSVNDDLSPNLLDQNKDYQNEIKQLTDQYNELKLESEQRLMEHRKLLEIRSNRIKQLENQLRVLTYGTLNKYKLHIGQLYLLPSLLSKYYPTISSNINHDNNYKNEEFIQLFLTWDFYDYETQATSILLVHDSIDFNMTIQYPIEVNDTLMNYLIKEPCTVEMHQVINSNYRTIAIGKLNFSQLFTGKDDIIELLGPGSVIRRHGQLDLFLISTPDNSMNINEVNKVNEKIKVGTLDYWIRLSAPMSDSIKLYKERFQQLPKSMSSIQQDLLPIDPLQNILTIEIVKITNLTKNYLDHLPSIYFVYQFYNQSEYASMIMKENITPIFNDCRTIQLEMNDKLDK
uniref:Protein fantom n=1 Tax=Schistosoma haematobium TaxID=6185 RepID=A0A094ZH25_SCHHA